MSESKEKKGVSVIIIGDPGEVDNTYLKFDRNTRSAQYPKRENNKLTFSFQYFGEANNTLGILSTKVELDNIKKNNRLLTRPKTVRPSYFHDHPFDFHSIPPPNPSPRME